MNLSESSAVARKMASSGNFAEAARVLDSGIRSAPLAVEERYLLGVAKIAAGDHAGGRTEIVRSLIVAPGASLHWHQLGCFYAKTGMLEAARKCWWRAWNRDPLNEDIQSDLLTSFPAQISMSIGRLLNLGETTLRGFNLRLFGRFVNLAAGPAILSKELGFRLVRQALLVFPDRAAL